MLSALFTHVFVFLTKRALAAAAGELPYGMDMIKICLTYGHAAVELSAFLHGETLSDDVAVDNGATTEMAALALHIALNIAVYMNLTGLDVALDASLLGDGDLTGIGADFALYAAVDVHVIVELDGTNDFDTGSEYVVCVAHK